MADRTLTLPQVTDLLDRSYHAVKTRRTTLNNGGTTNPFWTVEEDVFIRNTLHLSNAAVARELGRTRRAVAHRRMTLGLRSANGCGPNTVDSPHAIGQRALLARTCWKCGLLLDGSWFYPVRNRKTGNSTWSARCVRCLGQPTPGQTRRQPRPRPHGEARYRQAMAAITQPRATRTGEPYGERDHQVLADPNLSKLEKALKLGRTFAAVDRALATFHYRSLRGRGDPAHVQWIIRLRDDLDVEAPA